MTKITTLFGPNGRQNHEAPSTDAVDRYLETCESIIGPVSDHIAASIFATIEKNGEFNHRIHSCASYPSAMQYYHNSRRQTGLPLTNPDDSFAPPNLEAIRNNPAEFLRSQDSLNRQHARGIEEKIKNFKDTEISAHFDEDERFVIDQYHNIISANAGTNDSLVLTDNEIASLIDRTHGNRFFSRTVNPRRFIDDVIAKEKTLISRQLSTPELVDRAVRDPSKVIDAFRTYLRSEDPSTGGVHFDKYVKIIQSSKGDLLEDARHIGIEFVQGLHESGKLNQLFTETLGEWNANLSNRSQAPNLASISTTRTVTIDPTSPAPQT